MLHRGPLQIVKPIVKEYKFLYLRTIYYVRNKRKTNIRVINKNKYFYYISNYFIIIFLHGLGRLTCSGIDALPSFPEASAIPSSLGFVGEGVFRESGVVHSFEVVDPVLFVFESRVLYSRDV